MKTAFDRRSGPASEVSIVTAQNGFDLADR